MDETEHVKKCAINIPYGYTVAKLATLFPRSGISALTSYPQDGWAGRPEPTVDPNIYSGNFTDNEAQQLHDLGASPRDIPREYRSKSLTQK